MLVFLIGFMGCGKTTIGKRVASKLNWQFIDLDHYIENLKGNTIASIFHNEGEEKFREYEHSALLEIIKEKDNTIISTGGGTPCFFDNMKLMNKHGNTIYLQANIGILQNRLTFSKNKRPLIKQLNHNELIEFVDHKLAEREPFYLEANHVIDARSIRINQIIKLANP